MTFNHKENGDISPEPLKWVLSANVWLGIIWKGIVVVVGLVAAWVLMWGNSHYASKEKTDAAVIESKQSISNYGRDKVQLDKDGLLNDARMAKFDVKIDGIIASLINIQLMLTARTGVENNLNQEISDLRQTINEILKKQEANTNFRHEIQPMLEQIKDHIRSEKTNEK